MTKPVAVPPAWRDVFWIPRELMDPNDPKVGRPAVVVEVMAGPAGRARVVSRTRDSVRGRNGVRHLAQPELRLFDSGWFTDEYWIDLVAFSRPPMDYRGPLEIEAMERVEAMFS